jgi:nucleoside-diphosphate-sugar epimerase
MSPIRKTAAVTGASGYLGSALVKQLIKASYDVIRVSRTNLPPIEGVTSITADIQTPAPWALLAKADVVYHLAAVTSAYESEQKPIESLQAALFPVAHLLGAVKQTNKRPKVVFASTATVYGICPVMVISEHQSASPVTAYDLHKFFVERQLQLASEQGLIDAVCLRLANVYGPSTSASGSLDRGILNRVVAAAFRGEDITLYGDGNYLRDYVHIDDVIRAFLLAGARSALSFDIFNVATGRSVTLRDAFMQVCTAVKRVNGKSLGIKYAPWPENSHAIEYRNYTYDISRIRGELNWHPRITLEEGIDQMLSQLNRQKK